ncbi:MAG: methyltransferase domain-containing protein [Actinomycetota bacterium]|nr:methyltransferase domain-containing protein [Actinomycetota bacterium]
MTEPFDRELIARIFDEYGDAEWTRHESTPLRRVSFHDHRYYLRRFVRAGDRVFEVGAGAGRFTVELARLGARVTVVDISPEQLRLNEVHLGEAGLEDEVEARYVADVLDLSRFEDRAFDATVCYGGPLSWVLDGADHALDELFRVTKTQGHVLLGVMSRFASWHAFLAAAAEEIREYGLQEMQDIVETGYLPDNHSTLGPLHLYTWAEPQGAARTTSMRHRAVASAANFLSTGNDETCERWIQDDPAMWERFLAWEVAACSEPGAIDSGTHILAVVEPLVVEESRNITPATIQALTNTGRISRRPARMRR